MNEEELEKFAEDIASKWDDDYTGCTWFAYQIVEMFIIWLYENGGEIKLGTKKDKAG